MNPVKKRTVPCSPFKRSASLDQAPSVQLYQNRDNVTSFFFSQDFQMRYLQCSRPAIQRREFHETFDQQKPSLHAGKSIQWLPRLWILLRNSRDLIDRFGRVPLVTGWIHA